MPRTAAARNAWRCTSTRGRFTSRPAMERRGFPHFSLPSRRSSRQPYVTETRGACCYCGVGCGVIVETKDGRISGVRGDPEHPANFGRLCTKGTTLHLTAHGHGRALYPELRASRASSRTRHRWDETLDHLADR